MADPKLLPCPFCNGRATFEEIPQKGDRDQRIFWSVGCANEDVSCIGTQMIAMYDTKKLAAEEWNTRMGQKIKPEHLKVPSISISFSFYDNAHMVILDPDDRKNFQLNFHYSLRWSPLCSKLVDKNELISALHLLHPAGEVMK